MKKLSLVALLLMALALLDLLAINSLLASGAFGIAIQVAALCLMIWARVTFEAVPIRGRPVGTLPARVDRS